MFGVTADESGQESSQLLDEFVLLQKEIFSSLKLHFRLSSNLVQCCEKAAWFLLFMCISRTK